MLQTDPSQSLGEVGSVNSSSLPSTLVSMKQFSQYFTLSNKETHLMAQLLHRTGVKLANADARPARAFLTA